MESSDVRADFAGFGPINTSKTTFMGGHGIGSSFSPSFRTPLSLGNSPAVLTNNPTFAFGVWRQYNGSALKYGVNYFSDLRSNFIDHNSEETISGLLGNNPTDTDAGWFTAASGDKIYLEVEFTSGVFTSASIEHGSTYAGGIWVTNGDVQHDGGSPPTQTFARKLIATINSDLTVDQKLNTSLGLADFCINGIPAKYFIPI